jgi:hypothetical protein
MKREEIMRTSSLFGLNSSSAPGYLAAVQKHCNACPHPRSDLRAGRQQDASIDCGALGRECDHTDQEGRRFVDIFEVEQPAPNLSPQPTRQRGGGAGNAVVVKRRRQIGGLGGLQQNNALKRHDIRIERKIGARRQSCVQPDFDVHVLGYVQARSRTRSCRAWSCAMPANSAALCTRGETLWWTRRRGKPRFPRWSPNVRWQRIRTARPRGSFEAFRGLGKVEDAGETLPSPEDFASATSLHDACQFD